MCPSSRFRGSQIEKCAIESTGGVRGPGPVLPCDIGQLTAQASRIAGDVGDITQRIGQAFDSTALKTCTKRVTTGCYLRQDG